MILMHFSLFESVESVKIRDERQKKCAAKSYKSNHTAQLIHPVRSVCIEVTLLAIIRMRNALKGLQPASDSKSALWIFLYSGSILSLDLAVKPTKSSPSTRSQACTISKPVSHQVVIWASRLVQCSCASSSLVWYLARPPFTARTMGSDNHSRSPCHGWCARESLQESGSGRDPDEDWCSSKQSKGVMMCKI